MAEQVAAVSDVLDATERADWQRLARLLHPEVRWTTAAEEDLQGHEEVVGRLSRDPPPAPPSTGGHGEPRRALPVVGSDLAYIRHPSSRGVWSTCHCSPIALNRSCARWTSVSSSWRSPSARRRNGSR